MKQDKISFYSAEAEPYILEAANSLWEQGKSMIQELPEIIYIAGKAVNSRIKGVFKECDFTYALFIVRDEGRPGRIFLGLSALSSLACMDSSIYMMNSTNKGILEYLDSELTPYGVAIELLGLMDSVYKHAT
ncbi:MAG: hypothetical protein IJ151_08315 [Bacteroidales bacterium]|nr:hypothetical protein [Bacteroidales bacterium]